MDNRIISIQCEMLYIQHQIYMYMHPLHKYLYSPVYIMWNWKLQTTPSELQIPSGYNHWSLIWKQSWLVSLIPRCLSSWHHRARAGPFSDDIIDRFHPLRLLIVNGMAHPLVQFSHLIWTRWIFYEHFTEKHLQSMNISNCLQLKKNIYK